MGFGDHAETGRTGEDGTGHKGSLSTDLVRLWCWSALVTLWLTSGNPGESGNVVRFQSNFKHLHCVHEVLRPQLAHT